MNKRLQGVLEGGQPVGFDETLEMIVPKVEFGLLVGITLKLEGRTIFFEITNGDGYQNLEVDIEVNS